MYFINKYHWQNDQLTDKSVVGFFRILKKASYFSRFILPYDGRHDVVVIYKAQEGVKDYAHPRLVLEWSEYYQLYIPVCRKDPRYKMVVSY